MNKMNDTNRVAEQYSDDARLQLRINFHQKYSTANQSYADWLFDNYHFFENCSILELGCGNGDMWENKISDLPCGTRIVLSDFSDGMVGCVRNKYGAFPNVSCQRIDIIDIPFESDSFDIVIANSMLYHVPNLEKAVGEIHRVLKPEGTLYAATFGEHGLLEYICDVLGFPGDDAGKTFTLQNGGYVLKKFFSKSETLFHKDSLLVTDVNDTADYVMSMTSFMATDMSKAEIAAKFAAKAENGVIEIPKEYGTFIAVK